jgi:hypothetical protein
MRKGSLGNLAQGFGAMTGPIAKQWPPFPHTVRQVADAIFGSVP